MSCPNEEVNCTEPSPSVSIPWIQSLCPDMICQKKNDESAGKRESLLAKTNIYHFLLKHRHRNIQTKNQA